MNVSVIIVNYNTRELTLQCIRSVYEFTKNIDFEVIVVDNASSDGSSAAIKSHFAHVRIIESNENLGFGRGNNLGAKIAQGKYIFFLNSDTRLLNNSIKIFHNHMLANPLTAICGGSLFLKENLPTHSYGHFPNISNDIFFSLHLDKIFKFFTRREKEKLVRKITKVDYITGADMFMSKKIFDEVGTFDEDFFMYYEEAELTYRIRKKNYQVFIIPDAQIIHYGQMINMTPEKFRMYFISKFLYFKKTKGILSSIFIKYWWILIFLIRAIFFLRKKEIIYIKILLKNSL